MAEVFAVAGEKQEMVAGEATIALLKRFAANPDVEKARSEFERAQKIEETFHRDFDGIDFTSSGNSPLAGLAGAQLSLDLSVAQRVGFVLALL